MNGLKKWVWNLRYWMRWEEIRRRWWVRYNRWWFRRKGVRFGRNMQVYDRVYLQMGRGGRLEIGDDFVFSSGGAYNPLCRNVRGCIRVEDGAMVRIGNGVGMSSTTLWAKTSITIGNNVNIGGDCIVLDSDCHSLDYMTRRDRRRDPLSDKRKPVVIEDDVLVGARCIILKGVTIGARSVVGAGSVVTRSVEADSVTAGNPAVKIRDKR